MDCTRCRSLLSDFVEASLPPRTRAEVAAHAQACGACATELRRLEKMLALVRAAPREEPPPDLAAAVVARLGAEAAAIAVRERKGLVFARTMRRFAAAAAIALVGLAVVAVLREGWWRKRLDGADTKLASARSDNETLRGELAAAQGRAKTAADDIAAALASSKESQREHTEALARLKDEFRLREREIAALKESLTASRKETERLAAEVAKVAAARAVSEPRATEPRATAPGKEAPPPRVEPTAVAAVETPLPARRSVIFVARGDQLELRTRGSREQVITELFAVAADETNPETANLALSALENFLGRGTRGEAGAVAAGRRTGIMGWLNERFDDAGGEESQNSIDEAQDRRRILAELEDAWRRERESSKE